MRLIKTISAVLLIIAVIGAGMAFYIDTDVTKQGDQVVLIDRTGEHWDITQAVSIGFDPNGFQFGIGRHAIVPLDASSLRINDTSLDDKARVIGVENGSDAHAYAIRKLTRHEIANTQLGDTPIAAAY